MLNHTRESGYHTYTATLSGSGGARVVTHSPNPSQGGAGDLEVIGAVTAEEVALVLFQGTFGPAAMWSEWLLVAVPIDPVHAGGRPRATE